MKRPYSARALAIEFSLMFVGLPLALYFLKPHGAIYSLLWIIALYSLYLLVRHYHYSLAADWNWAGLSRQAIKKIVRRFLPFAAALLLFTIITIPERLFSLPLEKPYVWMMVMVLYPLLSVLPQEMIYRSFFFRHYARLPISDNALVALNAFAFGWVHVVLHNWVAVVFSAIGGYLFADTYRKTHSLAAVCFEHALYGCYIFTIGLGWYFYHGNAVR